MTINDLLESYNHKLVILIDLSWVMYRSHFAYKLTNSAGEPTGTYYGLCRTLQTLKTNYNDALILLVDDGTPLARKQLNESYKGNREHTVHFSDKKHNVDCLIQAVPDVYRVYNPIAEADDLMFSISRIKDYGNEFIIYTSDKDLYQSLDDTTKLASEIDKGKLVLKDTSSDQYVKYFSDLEPFQVPFYRAILGDPSDNLSSIRPRFPSKIAYYFAKNCVGRLEDKVAVYRTLPTDLTQKQQEALEEIYGNETFINNLKLMKLEFIDDIPVIKKEKTQDEVSAVINNFELKQYAAWLPTLY